MMHLPLSVSWQAFLFQIVSDLRATDPRDRLYGLMGMLPMLDAPALTPDYRKSPAEVFKGLASSLIEERRSLDILCGEHENFEGLPS